MPALIIKSSNNNFKYASQKARDFARAEAAKSCVRFGKFKRRKTPEDNGVFRFGRVWDAHGDSGDTVARVVEVDPVCAPIVKPSAKFFKEYGGFCFAIALFGIPSLFDKPLPRSPHKR
jgi:hypothetical protein